MEEGIQVRFLHEIDRKILDHSLPLEDLFSFVINHIVRLVQIDVGYFYLISTNKLLLLCSSWSNNDTGTLILEDTELLDKLESSPYISHEISSPNNTLIPAYSKHSHTRVILPIHLDGRLWGIMCFESSQPIISSPLTEREIVKFLQVVRDQLSIALEIRHQYRELAQLTRIQNDFFSRELDIADSLNSLVDNVISSLPSIKPLKIAPPPDVQILFYRQNHDYLTLRATSGKEALNTRIPVKESISGILIENPELPFFLCDPKEYPERYKSYLGRDDAGVLRKEIRTELVAPLRWGNRIIGIINLESEYVMAFRVQHIVTVLHLAEQVSAIINGLQKRVQKTKFQDQASLYAMNRFLDRFSRTYNHKMGSPISEVYLNLNLIRSKILSSNQIQEPLKSGLDGNLDLCVDGIEQINSYHTRYTQDLPGFLIFGKYSINNIIKGAIDDLRPDSLKRKYDIEAEFQAKEDFQVFCSLFLREHIFNILNNSRYSLLERKKSDKDYRGKITIETSLEVDEIEEDLNRRCKIRIRDNGKGIEKEFLQEVVNPFFTTKPKGTGFGLFAATQYLKSIGGTLEVDSLSNEFFEVVLKVDLYDETIHRDLEIFSPSKMEGG